MMITYELQTTFTIFVHIFLFKPLLLNAPYLIFDTKQQTVSYKNKNWRPFQLYEDNFAFAINLNYLPMDTKSPKLSPLDYKNNYFLYKENTYRLHLYMYFI